MNQILVRRPARLTAPAVPTEPIKIVPPPKFEPPPSGMASMLQFAFPIIGSLGGLIFLITNPKPIMVVSGLTFALASIGMGVGVGIQQRGGARNRLRTLRERYLKYIAETRSEARAVAVKQREAAAFRNPGVEELPAIARSDVRRWERRRSDPDFLLTRPGSGTVELASALLLDDRADPLAWDDPVCADAARRLVEVHGGVADQPIAVPLEELPVVSIVGPSDSARALARAMVAQIATLHAPEDVRLAVCAGPTATASWDALKWLPHLEPTTRSDGSAVGPSVAGSAERLHTRVVGEIESLARAASAGDGQAAADQPARRLVVVVDGVLPSPETIALVRHQGSPVRILVLAPTQRDEPTAVDLRLRIDERGALAVERIGQPGRRSATTDAPPLGATSGRADSMGPAAFETVARTLAPIRLTLTSEGGTLSRAVDLPELLGIEDLAGLDARALWAGKPLRDRLRVPMGFDPEGNAVILDIKESDLGGDGPHGLVIGATGSGKSELLRTIITGLAMTHSPSLLSFVLVDFKGGAAFAGLSSFPHVAGVITNLADDLSMIDRMYAALFGEMRRRQELLRDAGNVASVRDYHKLQESGRELPALPYLLIVVDEFGELLSNRPEFIDLFVAIGRLGRSLGMHLLLSSQQLDEGRLRGLESHLSYRIALRTFSAGESRTVLGVPDAYYLPPLPGSGYLRTGPSDLRRFRAATVSLPARVGPPETVVARPEAFVLGDLADRPSAAKPQADTPAAGKTGSRAAPLPTVVDVVVAALQNSGETVHQIWQPPLPARLPLDAVLGPAVADTERGLRATNMPGRPLDVPLGLVDRPADQVVAPFSLSLGDGGGSLLVVGAPQTGKSTLLQTLVISLALTATPLEAEVHIIDFGGGSLAGVAHLPHVGTVCGREDPERIRRTVAEIAARVDARERYFRANGIASADALRQLRAQGTLPEPVPDVFLIVDNWPAMRAQHEDLEPALADIAARGLGYGLHVILTANRWIDIRKALMDSIAGRLELRLQEPAESAIDRKAAANVAARIPGRGLTQGPLHVQVALPRMDGRTQMADLPRAVMDLADRVAGGWTGRRAERIRVLPTMLPAAEMPEPGSDSGRGVPLGLAESDLAPVYVDLAGRDRNFLILGDGESGKTTALRTLLSGLQKRSDPASVQISLLDYRRKLLRSVSEDFRLSYAFSAVMATDQMAELAQMLRRRLPHSGLTMAQLQSGRWWSGPDVYVVIDDYDLVSTSAGNPLLPLAELLPQARDIGLHVVMARRVRGLTRAFEPFINAMRDLGPTGLLLSGDPQEGAVLGQYRASAQLPGRALLVRRGEPGAVMQVAFSEE